MPTKNMIIHGEVNGVMTVLHPETDASSIVDFVDAVQTNSPINMFKPNTAYAAGDNVNATELPSHMYLECIHAGTTGTTPLNFSGINVGDVLNDGTVVWVVRSNNIFTAGDKIDIDMIGSGNGASGPSAFVASAPEFYSATGLFTTPNQMEIETPEEVWANINDIGYKLTGTVLDLEDITNWDCNPTTHATNRSYAINDVVESTSSEYLYLCTTAGTTDATAPTWNDTVGATTIDGTVEWTTILNPTVNTNRAGKDIYIYGVIDKNGAHYKLSTQSTVPIGFNSNTSRKLGGFHALCLAVGTIANHPLSDFDTGAVLPLSIWSLNHRPMCEPEGMVWIEGLNLWVDIYLASWDSANDRLQSRFNAVIADGASTPAWTQIAFSEQVGKQGRREAHINEFRVFAKGNPEGTSIGTTDPNTTGGHVNTAGRRMISNYGIEDAIGVMWQSSMDEHEYWPGTSLTSNTYGYFLTSYSWSGLTVGSGHGQAAALMRRAEYGGSYADTATVSGSRCTRYNHFPSSALVNRATRTVCRPLH